MKKALKYFLLGSAGDMVVKALDPMCQTLWFESLTWWLKKHARGDQQLMAM